MPKDEILATWIWPVRVWKIDSKSILNNSRVVFFSFLNKKRDQIPITLWYTCINNNKLKLVNLYVQEKYYNKKSKMETNLAHYITFSPNIKCKRSNISLKLHLSQSFLNCWLHTSSINYLKNKHQLLKFKSAYKMV